MVNIAVSLSGPSKSGKTVLVKKLISDDNLIPVSGAAVKEPEQLWEQVLQWMGAPASVSTSSQKSGSTQLGGTAGGSGDLFGFVKASAETRASATIGHQSTVTETDRSELIPQIIKEIADSDFVIFVDDYHYIDREVQFVLGRQIKALAENRVNVCVASVPHRADDVLRSNTELSGRVASIALGYWALSDLEVIAYRGFKALCIEFEDHVVNRLAREAFGTPQLMQLLCLNLCLELGVRETQREQRCIDVTKEHIVQALERTSDYADFSSVAHGLHSGPKERGTERKQFNFTDGTKGDVYRCVLLALRQDPPQTDFTYDDIMRRIREVSVGEAPVGSSVSNALAQMQTLSSSLSPNVPLIEWSENILSIVEPYFLFFLRASKKLDRINANYWEVQN